MRKTLVLLDCDGPLAKFVHGFLDIIEEETGHRFGDSVVTEWEIGDSPFFIKLAEEIGREKKELEAAVWKRANRIGFCQSLHVVPGAQEAVERLRALDLDVEVVTSPLVSSPTWMNERHEWLHRHFGFTKNQVHLVAAKHRVPGDFLVDDKPAHVGGWQDTSYYASWHAHGLLWDAPYNRNVEDCGTRVDSWEKIVEIVGLREHGLRGPGMTAQAIAVPGPYSST